MKLILQLDQEWQKYFEPLSSEELTKIIFNAAEKLSIEIDNEGC